MEVDLLTALLAAAGSAGGCWGAVKVELRYLRRDLDRVKAEQVKLKRGIAWLQARRQTAG